MQIAAREQPTTDLAIYFYVIPILEFKSTLFLPRPRVIWRMVQFCYNFNSNIK